MSELIEDAEKYLRALPPRMDGSRAEIIIRLLVKGNVEQQAKIDKLEKALILSRGMFTANGMYPEHTFEVIDEALAELKQ